MAGTDTAFDADDFRTNIRATMLMGLTAEEADRPKFLFNTTETFAGEVDATGAPFDFTDTPTVSSTASVQVLCALEWASGKNTGTEGRIMGDFEEGDLVITVLDEEYEEIKGADKVEVDGTQYEIRFVQPSVGLFNVTVFSLHCTTYNQK